MEEEREYILDVEQGDFPLFDILDMDEFNSLMKSNRLGWAYRRVVRDKYLPMRNIREYIPTIACVAVGSVIMEIFNNKK
jgi:hypothetical protein